MTDTILQRQHIQEKIKSAIENLNGWMYADEYRHYILGLIFCKFLSDKLHNFADSILERDGIVFSDLDETTENGREILAAVRSATIDELGCFLMPSELFSVIAAKGSQEGAFILDDLKALLSNIEQSALSECGYEEFDGLFNDLDLTSPKLGRTEEEKNSLISSILSELNRIDLLISDVQSDVLGDAYEYLISKFASGARKSAGEFYTPQTVSKILARIVSHGKTQLKSVYDPTCGSGSLLLRVAREVPNVGTFYGQEMSITTCNLARMNMILHGVHYTGFDIRQGNTLEDPQHWDLRAEAIVANPPFSAKWAADEEYGYDERFAPYGRLAPKSKADYAFVAHMLHHLDDNGTMAVVLPHGALFRGGAEGEIRKQIIQKNLLDAVIGLPSKIFYGTSIPSCIMVFRKNRQTRDVLFVDASQCFEKGRAQNYLREVDVDRITDTYSDRIFEARFSYLATSDEIVANGWNLNIPRYVDTQEAEALRDLSSIARESRATIAKGKILDDEIRAACLALGLESPV